MKVQSYFIMLNTHKSVSFVNKIDYKVVKIAEREIRTENIYPIKNWADRKTCNFIFRIEARGGAKRSRDKVVQLLNRQNKVEGFT